MKSTGKAACILPHGVLFRGNAEAVIRQQLVRSGILKGIIGLPANLFYGTGIPACIVVLDKENADSPQGRVHDRRLPRASSRTATRTACASRTSTASSTPSRKQTDVPRYARMVPLDEIADPKNDFNLNLPRYIDSTRARGPSGHRRPPARRHPGARPRRARRVLAGAAQRARRAVRVRWPPRLCAASSCRSPR